ncbi:MAG: methylenetetrahydrofolate reductase [NAD(P)H] [Myxococcota bacterium]
MPIAELYGCGRPVFSFEFFPPKTDAGYEVLYRTVDDLKRLNPDFVSVTWGAGGSTRRKTVEIVARIQREIGVRAMAHLSCIGSTPDQLEATLDELHRAGIENVLALGGDRPRDYEQPEGAFTYANELAEFIKRVRPGFCLGGACYPETHPLAESPEADLRNLVRKVGAGIDFLITQLFFDNQDFFDFCGRARDAGITIPIVPGIMPILGAASIRRMTTLSGAKIPRELELRLDEVGDDDERTYDVGVAWATMQCRELLDRGVPGIHFYTLNKSQATQNIFRNLLER